MCQVHFEQLDPSKLRPFSLNKSVFGDIEKELDAEFLESIKTDGVHTPVVVTTKGLILSGHRRVAASIRAGHRLIPCYVKNESDSIAIKKIWFQCCQQRHPTEEQKTRYFNAVNEVKALEAAERKKSGKKQESDLGVISPQGRAPRAADIAAETIGVSRQKAARMSATVAVIDEAEEAGDTETAAELRDTLENKSASEAARKAKAAKVKLRRAKAAAEKKAAKEAERQAVIDAGGEPEAEAEAEADPEPAAEEADPEPAKPTDQNGKVLPKHLIEIFEKRSFFKDVLNKLTQLQKSYNALVADDNEYATRNMNKVQARNDLKNFKNQIQFAMPHALCPYCKGTGKDKGGGCVACKGACWVVESTYNAAPVEMR